VEAVFADYERLLWRVLAHLAQLGYVLPPGESRDIIHDFYVEAWDDLVRRFDPQKGRFSTYLFAAFFRFARRRILRWHQWHGPLQSLKELADPKAGVPVDKEPIDEPQLAAMRVALGKLSTVQRAVLSELLTGRVSERELATRHQMTRYRLQETLIDSIGQVMTELGENALPRTTEGQVALALWRDGRSVPDAAALLGLPVPLVQDARRRLVHGILANLRSMS
jgi:hypothetical protein